MPAPAMVLILSPSKDEDHARRYPIFSRTKPMPPVGLS